MESSSNQQKIGKARRLSRKKRTKEEALKIEQRFKKNCHCKHP